MNSARSAEKFLFYAGSFCWFFDKQLPKVNCYGYRETYGQATGIADRHALTPPAGFRGWGVDQKLGV
jgi:hypothetical protein